MTKFSVSSMGIMTNWRKGSVEKDILYFFFWLINQERKIHLQLTASFECTLLWSNDFVFDGGFNLGELCNECGCLGCLQDLPQNKLLSLFMKGKKKTSTRKI